MPSTSPKKRSLMPSGKLRQSLRGHGHRLSPIVQVGKGGVTPGLIKQLEQALADHELIKVKVAADGPASRFEVADALGALPGVNVVQVVGGVVLLYKRHPSEGRYEGQRPPAPVAPGGAREAVRGKEPAGKRKRETGRPTRGDQRRERKPPERKPAERKSPARRTPRRPTRR